MSTAHRSRRRRVASLARRLRERQDLIPITGSLVVALLGLAFVVYYNFFR
jgi:hypothetical protein